MIHAMIYICQDHDTSHDTHDTSHDTHNHAMIHAMHDTRVRSCMGKQILHCEMVASA